MKLKQLKNYFVLVGLSLAGFTANAQTSPRKFIDPANMDLTVKPGDDFYQYASGTWIKNNPVPAKETRWGSFNELREFNIQAVRSLVETAAADKNAPAGSISRRVGDFFAAAMDSIAIEKLGYSPIKSDLQKIKQINSLQSLLDHVANMRVSGIASPMFGVNVAQDKKNVTKYIVNLSQGMNGLGDRDFYLRDDPQSKRLRTAYNLYMEKLFSLVGYSSADSKKKLKQFLTWKNHWPKHK